MKDAELCLEFKVADADANLLIGFPQNNLGNLSCFWI